MKLTDAQTIKMTEYGIPVRMHGGIIRYYEKGIPPGSFLTAVINNDLKEAVNRADATNVNCLKAYVMWFYNQAPGGSWGHEGACDNWIKEFIHEI
jgi:hypothetical protein